MVSQHWNQSMDEPAVPELTFFLVNHPFDTSHDNLMPLFFPVKLSDHKEQFQTNK